MRQRRAPSLTLGRSQARWIALGILVIVAAAAYAWGANGQVLEIYYAAAVRSMASSWHNFFFGAFDPAGTVSLDKLPGAFWIQALSVRIFGLHAWAIVLPQIIEGAATVAVLGLAVRQAAGGVAGVGAAALLVLSPATVALDRGNISDSLLVLLMVLAAAATNRAMTSGRLRTLLLAGGLVGLAFQAKMLEAWILLPALAVPYAVAAPGSVRRRLGHLALAGAVVVVVSLSWMTVVMLIPAHSRPYVDGSHDNSTYAQVFQYNGLGRAQSPLAAASHADPVVAPLLAAFTISQGRGWDRLLVGRAGRDIGWLLPAALLAALATLLARRRRDRTDPVRASVLMWGLWLVTLCVAFSVAGQINAYYLAALSPPVAALCAIGAQTFWRARERRSAWVALAAVIAITVIYAVVLLPSSDAPGWLAPAAAVLGATAVLMVLLAATRRDRTQLTRLTGVALAAAFAAPALVPAVAAAAIVTDHRGPFDTPFQPPGITAVTETLASQLNRPPASLIALAQRGATLRYPLATYTSLIGAPLVFATGDEVLPIGGFTGTNPSPTLARLQALIAHGELAVILGPITTDPRMRWAAAHCRMPIQGLPIPVLVCGLAA